MPQRPRLAQVDGTVGHDPKQPRPERTAALEAVDLHQRRQESLLNDVFGILPLAEQPIRHAERTSHVPVRQLVEGGGVACLDGLHQAGFILVGFLRRDRSAGHLHARVSSGGCKVVDGAPKHAVHGVNGRRPRSSWCRRVSLGSAAPAASRRWCAAVSVVQASAGG
jgi:hypothetical protein